jgi:branched-chain amino acid transport system substrate-binding protein
MMGRIPRRHAAFGAALTLAGVMALSGCGSHLSQAALERANGALQVNAGSQTTGALAAGGAGDQGAGAQAAGTAGGAAGAVGSSAGSATAGPGGAATPSAGGGNTGLPGAGGAASALGPAGPRSELVFGSLGTAAGVLGAVSGPAPPAIRAWVSAVNATGGLGGHPVRVIQADDGGDPGRAQSIVQQFVEQDHVVAIFYDYMFSEKPAVLSYLESKNVPLIGTQGGDPSGDHSPIDFNPLTGPSTGIDWSFILGVHTFKPSITKLASFYCREAATCNIEEQGFKQFLPWNGIHLVYETQVSLAQPDFTAEVIQARSAGAEAILCLIDSNSVIRVAQAAQRQGWNVQLAGTYNLEQDIILPGAKDLEGLILTTREAPYQSSPKLQMYRDAMARYQPGQPVGDLGAGVFVVGDILQKIAPLLPAKPTSADLINALYSLHGEKLGGLLPGITFNKGTHQNVNQCIVPIVLHNGVFAAHDAAESFVCAPTWHPGT